ncbi:hypothetical protein F5Y12DRAFT_668383 [Xylaria sp. FL1777]|nr:hypothetical protein F5Y12DRAFT_668383 [Xylaria sp. FL1777]
MILFIWCIGFIYYTLPWMALTNSRRKLLKGWMSSPNSRGSIDIIWSSFFTISLCTWTTLCLNIPHPNDSDLTVLLRKGKWMICAILLPEFVLIISAGQYALARMSVQHFRRLGHHHWTLRHSFFVDMGGFLLQFEGGTPFVVNNAQLAFLVEKGYVECPKISAQEIWDRSKANLLSKIVALLQISWFLIQLIGRTIVHLPITTLELLTSAIVLYTVGNLGFWLNKPNDIQKGITLSLSVSLEDIMSANADGTALFNPHAAPSSTTSRSVGPSQNTHRPLPERFSNATYPNLSASHKLIFLCVAKGGVALHLLAWNFEFPTDIERLGWRVASSILMATSLAISAFEFLVYRPNTDCWDQYLNPRSHKQRSSQEKSANTLEEGNARAEITENTEATLHFLSIWRVVIMKAIAAIYLTARLFLVVEALVSLRSQPVKIYATLDVGHLFSG